MKLCEILCHFLNGSKSVEPHGSVGSNPTRSAISLFTDICKQAFSFIYGLF
ncbi:hypothetical protein OBV_43110 [Oscillibacter valericigenes Sjm18-20]|nr:hypothetical protein OBV_43110 [Oscillibacter valericigenes Sjm18-20]